MKHTAEEQLKEETGCFAQSSGAVKTMPIPTEDSIWLRLAYGFMGLIHYPRGEEHGSMQADMVADSSISRSEGSKKQESLGLELAFWNLKVLPQWHTSSNKARPTPKRTHS